MTKRLEIKDGDRTVGYLEAADTSRSESSPQPSSSNEEPNSEQSTRDKKIIVNDDSPDPVVPPPPPGDPNQDQPEKPFLREFLGI